MKSNVYANFIFELLYGSVLKAGLVLGWMFLMKNMYQCCFSYTTTITKTTTLVLLYIGN